MQLSILFEELSLTCPQLEELNFVGTHRTASPAAHVQLQYWS